VKAHFTCPACRTHLAASPDLMDTRVPCPECNTLLEVPHLPAESLVADGGPIPPSPPAAHEAAVGFGLPRASSDAEMDMTPMVDVTFLLLIFFMVTAAFSLQKSFEVPAPDESQPSTQTRTLQDFEEDPQYVIVRIDEYNTYHVSAASWDEEQEAPSEQELLIRLREAREGSGGGTIPTRLLVIANGEALHEYVVTALDAGTAVGMEEVQLVTVEEDV
jgi:biopolymer transport protein ExbD